MGYIKSLYIYAFMYLPLEYRESCSRFSYQKSESVGFAE